MVHCKKSKQQSIDHTVKLMMIIIIYISKGSLHNETGFTISYLHFVIYLDRVAHIFTVRSYFCYPLLKVKHVDGKLGGFWTWGSKQLSRILHEGLIGLEKEEGK